MFSGAACFANLLAPGLQRRRPNNPPGSVQVHEKPLHALSVAGFSNVDVTGRIDGHAMRVIELTELVPCPTETPNTLASGMVDDVNLLVAAIGDIDEPLLLIRRECEAPDGP